MNGWDAQAVRQVLEEAELVRPSVPLGNHSLTAALIAMLIVELRQMHTHFKGGLKVTRDDG